MSGITSEVQRATVHLHEHYNVEKELAPRLRAATQSKRRVLYPSVYDERLRCMPAHPLLLPARDPASNAAATAAGSIVSAPDGVFLQAGPGDCAVALAAARPSEAGAGSGCF